MLPFDQLTPAGRARRLRTLAVNVASQNYALDVTRVRLISAHSFNVIFRIDSTAGRFALRIGEAQRIHPLGVENVEAAWLDRLVGSGISSYRNVPAADGTPWVRRGHADIPNERMCTMFSWLDGHELRNDLTPESARRAGRLLAKLHEHAAAITDLAVPGQLATRQAIYFGTQNLVAQHKDPQRALINEATDRVQRVLDDLWHREPHHLLHGDFGPHNILTWRNQLRPIDFQDLRYGPAAHDVGISIADMQRSQPALIQPFMAGYAEIRTAPELNPEQLGALSVGRSLNIMNLALLAPTSGIARSYQSHRQRVLDWAT